MSRNTSDQDPDPINALGNQYELRATADRLSRLHEQQVDIENQDNSHRLPDETGLEDSDETDINLEGLEIQRIDNRGKMAALTPVTTRFVGNIQDLQDPDKHRLEAYNVHQFLADLDSRIVSQGITKDVDKIKEAQLLVHPEKGDAKEVLLSSMFSELASYEEW